MKTFLHTLLFLSLSSQATAAIKALILQEKDFDFSSSLSFSRTYNSRSLHNGLFGFGWCSDLEKKLIFKEKEIQYFDCRLSQPLNLNEVSTKKNGSVFGTLSLNQQQYVHRWPSGEEEIFDSTGKLLKITAKNTATLNVEYDKNNYPRQLTFKQKNKEQIFNLTYNPSIQKIVRVQSGSELANSYVYENQHLIKTQESQYQYDDLSNLVEVIRGPIHKKFYFDANDHFLGSM